MNYRITRLADSHVPIFDAAQWFHEKWGIPNEAYLESMQESLKENAVPEWYLVMCGDKIIGGAGVIENDFHDRPDLAPNVCAMFVEPERRGEGIAGELLDFICRDMASQGVSTLYLITDHTSFYERYGWEHIDFATNFGEDHKSRIYSRHTDTADVF